MGFVPLGGGGCINKFIDKIKLFLKNIVGKIKALEGFFDKKVKENYVKKNKTDFKIPMKQRKNVYAKTVVWSIIIFTVSSGLLAVAKVRDLNRQMIDQAKIITNIVDEGENDEKIYSPKLANFINDFVYLYVNMPNQMEQFDVRTNDLKKYFVSEKVIFSELPAGNIRRELTNQMLVDLTQSDGVITADVKVNYSLIKDEQIIGEEYTEREQHDQSMILTLKIMESNSSFFVISTPQFVGMFDENVTDSNLEFENKYENKADVNFEVAQTINEFLNEFFQKYASGTKEDVKYMMKKPTALNGNFEFISAANKVYNDKNGFVVLSTVVFSQQGIKQTETVTLHILEKDNNLFIEKMYLIKGGI